MDVCTAKMSTGFNHDEGEEWERELSEGHDGRHSSSWIEGTKMSGRWQYPVFDCVIAWAELTGLSPDA